MLLDPARAAFLAIDLQRAFCAEDGSVARQGRDIDTCRPAALRCVDLADRCRAAGLPVIWARLVLRADYGDGGLLTGELRPGLARIGGLRAGTPDVELIDEIRPAPQDFVVDKPRLSVFYGSALEAILRARRIDTLIVGGVTTSMCVETTVRDSGQRDMPTFVVRECCGDFDPKRHEAALDAIAFGFGRVISFDQATQALAQRGGDF